MPKNLALLDGVDSSDQFGLWVTDGTSAGTWEISVAGANPTGLVPKVFTAFGSEVLFIGSDANNHSGLWVTDGTSPGTSELAVAGGTAVVNGIGGPVVLGSEILFNGGFFGNLWVSDGTPAGTSQIPVTGAASGGLNVSNLIVRGSEVLFTGQDAGSHNGLWVTDGTTAGTSELTVAGASSAGLSPSTLTILGNKVLFAGQDQNGHNGLWVTDGTGAGTSELMVAGAASAGVHPSNFTVFGSKAVFEGTNASGNVGLWVTDGTSAGTSEVSVAGAFSDGIFDLAAPHFVTFGTEVLFEGSDNSGEFRGLWVTDGTSAGTSEISVAGASQGGVFFDPPSFFVFGSEVLFEGLDANQARSLWVTDGTAAGTSELTITGSDTSAGIFATAPPSFGRYRSEVLFSGRDSHALNGLWVTDGTAAGTSEISVAGAGTRDGLSPRNPTAFTQNLSQPVLSNVPGSDSYTERATPITVAPSVHVSDTNSSTLVSATIAVTGGTFATDGDVLAANTTRTSITAAYDSSSETLTLTGVDTLADYQEVLESITFSSPSHNPTNFGSDPARILTWVVDDGTASSNVSAPQTTTLNITAVNDPPTLSNVTSTFSYTEHGGPTLVLSPNVSVTDPDNLNLASATVRITGGAFMGDGDVLSAAGTSSISVSYNSSSETLTLTGTDTLTDYRAVLDSIPFISTGKNPTNYGSTPTRTVVWTLNDGSASSTAVTSTISITAVNDPPTLSNLVATSTAMGGQTVTLSPSLQVSDPDNLVFGGASVAVTGGRFTGDHDVLAASTGGTSITASYNSSTETLTLSGVDTLSDYQDVLRSVTFGAGLNATNFGSNPTRTLTWVLNDGSGSSNLSAPVTTTISIGSAPRNDVNADGMSDVLLQNTNGTPQIWLMNGASVSSMTSLINPGPSWQLAASGDFNVDGTADLLWQNNDGLPSIWEMNGTSIIGGGLLPNPGPSWHVIASGDFNADARADILFQNTDGAAAIWEMNGTSIIGGGVLINPGSSWHVIGAGDVNGDGKADILWQNTDGTPAIWEMNGTAIIGGGVLPNPGTSWHAIGTGDFNGDGKADILWQNTDGAPAVWELNGSNIIGGGVLLNPGASWHAIGTSDFNGDGKADIIWQNSDGLPAIWEMNGTSIIGGGILPNPGAGWQVKDDGPIPGDQMGTAASAGSAPAVNAALHLTAPDSFAGNAASLGDAAAPKWPGTFLPTGASTLFRT